MKDVLEGYTPFDVDGYGNTCQMKIIDPDIPSVKSELEALATY